MDGAGGKRPEARPAAQPQPQPEPPAARRGGARAATRPKTQRVEALERAFAILEAFADGAPRLTLAELTRRTGLYNSTALRLAATLEEGGFLLRDPDGRFRLGPSLWRLGSLYQRGFDLAAEVRPALDRLAEATGETAAFYVREGERRICLYRRHGAQEIRHHVEEGAELPLDSGASARVLRAFTGDAGPAHDVVRAAGGHVSFGEREPEAAAAAAPVFLAGGVFAGALTVAGLRARFSEARAAAVFRAVKAEAAALSARLGARPRR